MNNDIEQAITIKTQRLRPRQTVMAPRILSNTPTQRYVPLQQELPVGQPRRVPAMGRRPHWGLPRLGHPLWTSNEERPYNHRAPFWQGRCWPGETLLPSATSASVRCELRERAVKHGTTQPDASPTVFAGCVQLQIPLLSRGMRWIRAPVALAAPPAVQRMNEGDTHHDGRRHTCRHGSNTTYLR